jgi:hypothetical protein
LSYSESARARAKRRKSAWNLLLIPAVFGPLAFIWWISLLGLLEFHAMLTHELVLGRSPAFPGVIVFIAPIIAGLPVAMIIGNFLVRALPPARRALDAEAAGHVGTSYFAAQRQLFRISFLLVPVAAGASLLAAAFPWK